MRSKRTVVTLLGLTPPPNGGIASWTMRMLGSQLLKSQIDLGFVNESMPDGRATFGKKSKRSILKEAKRCLRIWSDLRRDLRMRKVDVVHSNIPAFPLSMLREIFCALIAKGYGAKFLIHFRCTVPIAANSRFAHLLLRVLLFCSDSAIVLNKVSEDYVQSLSQIPVYLIPNFVSLDEAPCSCHHAINKINTALYTGGIISEKGIDDIISLAQSIPEVTFLLAGQGELCGEAPSNVRLLGPLPKSELAPLYEQADVFLFLSRFKGEGFSNSLAEAMSAGLPCIVTDWAANADMVGPDGGFVVKSHDIDGMIEAMRRLDDPELRIQMGNTNCKKVQEYYSESVVMSEYINIYNRVSMQL